MAVFKRGKVWRYKFNRNGESRSGSEHETIAYPAETGASGNQKKQGREPQKLTGARQSVAAAREFVKI
jgi:hypothetical protein